MFPLLCRARHSPEKVDTGLSDDQFLILFRRAVPERGMEPRAVVEALDVLEHAAARLRPGIEGEVIEPLGLQGMEEALRRCIVETIAGPAHAADHPVLIEELLVVGARVGSAAIAVMHEAGRGATPRDGAVQRLERDGLLGARGGSPPHNPPREGIEEDREEEPALAGPDLSDVREPEVVGGLGGEVAGDPVRRGGQVGRAAGGDESEPSSCAASQALQLHKPGDAMLADGVPRAAQGAVDSRRAVDVPALAVHGADPVDQDRALPVPLTAGPPAPGVEAAARHAEDAAQLADSEFAGLLHEPELHFRSFAKYAKAFFKMSRSWVTSRSFCSSSRTRRACGARRPRPGNASVGVSVSCSRHRWSRLRAIPRCVATSVKDFPSSTTSRTASFLNCGVKVRRTRIVRLAMDHLVRASHGSYLGVHFSGELQAAAAAGSTTHHFGSGGGLLARSALARSTISSRSRFFTPVEVLAASSPIAITPLCWYAFLTR